MAIVIERDPEQPVNTFVEKPPQSYCCYCTLHDKHQHDQYDRKDDIPQPDVTSAPTP